MGDFLSPVKSSLYSLRFYRNYIEKTLSEGKEWMAPPAPCLAVQSMLHVSLLFAARLKPISRVFRITLRSKFCI